MDSTIGLYWHRLTRSMWARATAFSLLAIVSALAAIVLQPFLPKGLSASIGADAVDNVLSIIASSMLAVTTFSLGIAVSAYNSAASGATPRATTLLVEDPTTQNVLSTFLGSFLFSLVGIVVLRTGAYGEEGRVVLFVMTVVVIAIVVGTLLRWIDHLTEIGRMSDTLGRVETATRDAIKTRLAQPFLGCTPLPEDFRLPHGNHPLFAQEIGYVQHIDVSALSSLAEKFETRFAISALPGTFADPRREVLFSEQELDAKQKNAACSCFTIGVNRTFEQDPRFGVVVFAEIASRALSPAVNDPGTAISVIGRLVRILHQWNVGQPHEEPEVKYPNLLAPNLRMSDLFDDAFTSISRDAAGIIEVNVRLQKALAALAATGGTQEVQEQASRHSLLALQRAQLGLSLDDDRRIVQDLSAAVSSKNSEYPTRE